MHNRRSFIMSAAYSCTGLMLIGGGNQFWGTFLLGKEERRILQAFIPMPLQVVIDDVGWWSGNDGSMRQEPYRTGINRNHVPADYKAIVDLGRALDIRPQAALVLCEWDRENILKHLPTSTWMGSNWDNSKWVGPWLEEAVEIIRQNQEHMEITLHGIGHEYWQGGSFTRAEWTESNGQMRPKEQVEQHLEYFRKIMDQNSLGPFPKSFVPTAFCHSFGPSEGQKGSLAEILKGWGVNYINTPFSSIYNRDRILNDFFGFDSGVITVDRGIDEFPWLTFPANPSAESLGPTCGLHWPNMLHPDPEQNSEVVGRWVKYLKKYDDRPDRMLARNSEAFLHQLLNHSLTKISINGNSIDLDFTETDQQPELPGKDELTLKILTNKPARFTTEGIILESQNILEGNELCYVINLLRKKGEKIARIKVS